MEGKNYSRFILKGFKIQLPNDDNQEEYYDCEVLLTISSLGIAAFSFWVHLERELTSRQIAQMQLLPSKRVNLSVKIPISLLKKNVVLTKELSDLYEQEKEKDFVLLQNIDIGAILNLYWYVLVNIIHNHTFQNDELLQKELRYQPYWIFPYVIIRSYSTNPELNFADDLIERNPKQIYQILEQIYEFDYSLISSDMKMLNDTLKPNLSERRDIAYIDSLGSVLLILSPETEKLIENQVGVQKTPSVIELEYQKIILEGLIIIELLQIQRLYLGFLTQKLTQPIADMSPKEISIMRSYLSNALDMYYGNVTGNSLARKRLEHGKDILEIDEDFKMISKKMELLGDALNSFTTMKTNFFQIALALIFGIVPFLYIFSPPFNIPLWDSISAISITVGIILTFYLLSRWYWKRLKQKEI